MCLHGLDILSMWMLFFSLLCETVSAFQYSRLGKGVEIFYDILKMATTTYAASPTVTYSARTPVTDATPAVFFSRCMGVPWSCSAGVDEMSFHENSTVVSFSPFWCARKHSWKYVLLSALLHDQSCLQSLLAFSISLCGSLFLEPLFVRVGNYLFFRVHGSTRFVSSSLSYVAVSRSREKQVGQAFA